MWKIGKLKFRPFTHASPISVPNSISISLNPICSPNSNRFNTPILTIIMTFVIIPSNYCASFTLMYMDNCFIIYLFYLLYSFPNSGWCRPFTVTRNELHLEELQINTVLQWLENEVNVIKTNSSQILWSRVRTSVVVLFSTYHIKCKFYHSHYQFLITISTWRKCT